MTFHVPEKSRIVLGAMRSDASFGNNGAFTLASPEQGWSLFIVASDGLGWEHVSVHAERGEHPPRRQRTPNWAEMCLVKDRFWDDDDVVIQYHPRRVDYVNQHPHTLHLWRPIGIELPTPDALLVGVRG